MPKETRRSRLKRRYRKAAEEYHAQRNTPAARAETIDRDLNDIASYRKSVIEARSKCIAIEEERRKRIAIEEEITRLKQELAALRKQQGKGESSPSEASSS
jgi:hypothetical protein